MADRLENEPFLELHENAAPEQLGEQVQKAQEQLLQLKRQQELIEKQKRELEELARRQEQLQQGRAEMVEKFTRALVVLERQAYDAQKRVEQLKVTHETFVQHLDIIESINPKNWEGADIGKELSRALSAVDDARAEYQRARAVVNVDAEQEVIAAPDSGSMESHGEPGASAPVDFLQWLKSGFAFTLPLMAFGILVLVVIFLIRG
jgi:DNA repair exonuclease SbcCD ATPase subunit